MADSAPVDLEDQLRRYADAVEARWQADSGHGLGADGSIPAARATPPGPSWGETVGPHPYVGTRASGERWSARRLLTAAAAVVVAVAVAGAVLAAVRRAGSSIDAGQTSTTAAADRPGPDGSDGQPPGVPEAAARCRQALLEQDQMFAGPDEPNVVTQSVAVPDGVPVAASQLVLGGTARRVAFAFDNRFSSCVVASDGGVSIGSVIGTWREDFELPVEPDAIEPRGYGGEAKDWVIHGKAGADVTGVRARFADGTTFEGLVVGGWFVIDLSWPPDGPANLTPDEDVVMTWTLADGTERSSRLEFLTPAGLGGGAPCAADPACIPAKVAEVQAEAARRQAAGEPFDQGPAVADGVVTEEEFDAAMASFVNCSVARGLSGYVAPAPLFRDWAIFSLEPNTDPGAVFGYNVLLWPGPGQPAVTPPPPSVTTPSGGNPFLIEECRTTHVDLVSTLASVQDEKRRFDENAALATGTPGD